MSLPAPADLRVLCRILTSSAPEDLPRLCRALVGLVSRCAGPLSAHQDGKGKDKLSESASLVHKLRTRITALLQGKSAPGRFAAVVLVKAVVDVGGWECLRTSEAWIAGLLSVVRKPDALAAKELAIATLVRIYTMLQGYQTLIREMVTPTLPVFVAACLQLVTPVASRPLKVPISFVSHVASALACLIPLYSTTLRPYAKEIRAAFRAYLAPTSSDPQTVPQSLSQNARRLVLLLHYTAPKNGSSSEWEAGVVGMIRDCHVTANQVFRAVQEVWESSTGYHPPNVSHDGEPSGGRDSPDELAPWTGLQAGAERLCGLLDFLGDCFRGATKAPVTIPLGELLDLTSRLTLVTRPTSAGQGGRDDGLEVHAAIGRDERDHLYTVLPDIHLAVLRLHMAMMQRLGHNVLPLAADVLDQLIRVFKAGHSSSGNRESAYCLSTELLRIAGPGLMKITVDSMVPIFQHCCQDILEHKGHLHEEKAAVPGVGANGMKSKHVPGNADAFLSPQAGQTFSPTHLSRGHLDAAERLLVAIFSHVPQRHLTNEFRGLLDRTAILSNSREAMLASCLHPFKNSNGRYHASILPFLVRQFPDDQGVEVLRCNLRSVGVAAKVPWDAQDGSLLQRRVESPAALEVAVDDMLAELDSNIAKSRGGWPVPASAAIEVDHVSCIADEQHPDPLKGRSGTRSAMSPSAAIVPLKRRADESEPVPAKRVDKGKAIDVNLASLPPLPAQARPAKAGLPHDTDSDSDESVQIDMTFDDDEEEEDEEKGD